MKLIKVGKAGTLKGRRVYFVRSIPTPESFDPAEVAALEQAFEDAYVAANRVIASQERTHSLLQDCLIELREARHIVEASNRRAVARAEAYTQ